MEWEALGFTENPPSIQPIKLQTRSLYVGYDKEVRIGHNVFADKEVSLLVEGAKGIGTTSFANLIRFTAQEKKLYFTPQREIRVEPGWNLPTLLAAVIGTVIQELEFTFAKKIANKKAFQDAKAISSRIAETYRTLLPVMQFTGN